MTPEERANDTVHVFRSDEGWITARADELTESIAAAIRAAEQAMKERCFQTVADLELDTRDAITAKGRILQAIQTL